MTSLNATKDYPARNFLLVSILILTVFVTLVAVIDSLDLDRSISANFYSNSQGWAQGDQQPWQFLYEYGTIPGILFTLSALAGLLLSLFNPAWNKLRRPCFVILVTAILGGGLIVNGLLKDYWGRPRPRQTVEFGGQWQFQTISQKGIVGKGKSFPCGHCTMGFLLLTSIYAIPVNRRLALAGTALGIVYGLMISSARIIQGGHFLSDVLGSLTVLALTSQLAYFISLRLNFFQQTQTLGWSRQKKFSAVVAGLLLASIMTAFFLTRRPVFEDHRNNLDLQGDLRALEISINFDKDDVKIEYIEGNVGYLRATVRGFGWPEVSHRISIKRALEGDVYRVDYALIPKGYFAEKEINLQMALPLKFKESVIFIEKMASESSP